MRRMLEQNEQGGSGPPLPKKYSVPQLPARRRGSSGGGIKLIDGLPLVVKCSHEERNYSLEINQDAKAPTLEVVAGPGRPCTFEGLRHMHRVMTEPGKSLKVPEKLEITDNCGSKHSLLCEYPILDVSELWVLRDLGRLPPNRQPLDLGEHTWAFVWSYPDIRWDIDLTFDLGALKFDYDKKKDTFDLKYQNDWGVRGEGQEISKFRGHAYLDYAGKKIDCTFWVARWLPNLLGGWFYSLWDLHNFAIKIAEMGRGDWSQNTKQVVLGSSTIDLPVIRYQYKTSFQEQSDSPEVWVYRQKHWALEPAFGASLNWDILDTVLKLIPLGVGYFLSKLRKVRAGSPETGLGWHHELAIVLTASGSLIIAKGSEVLINRGKTEASHPTDGTGFKGEMLFGLEGVAKAKGAAFKVAFDAGIAAGARTALRFSKLVKEVGRQGGQWSDEPLAEGKEVSSDLQLRLLKLIIYYIQWATAGSVAEVFWNPGADLEGHHRDYHHDDGGGSGGKKVKKGEAYKREQLQMVFDGDCKIGKNRQEPTVFCKLNDIEEDERDNWEIHTLFEWERRYKKKKREYERFKDEHCTSWLNPRSWLGGRKLLDVSKKEDKKEAYDTYRMAEADLKSARALFEDVHFKVLWEDKVWTKEGRHKNAFGDQ